MLKLQRELKQKLKKPRSWAYQYSMISKNFLSGKNLEKTLLRVKPKHLYPEFNPKLSEIVDQIIPSSHISEFQNENWRIKNIEITEEQALFYNVKETQNYNNRLSLRPRYIKAGKYLVLYNKENRVVMSDTPIEKAEHYFFVKKAKEKVLIAGLGLSVVTWAVALKPEVTSVTVVEKDLDLILLLAKEYKTNPFYSSHPEIINKISVINDDIFNYVKKLTPQRRNSFTSVWFDIWNDISDENLTDMNKLMKKFPKAAINGCWAYNQTCYMHGINNLIERNRKLI